MAKADGKSRDAEMRRNDTHRNPAGTDSKRFAAADSAGDSSSRSRGKSGAEKRGSSTSAQRSGGGPSGASSHNAGNDNVQGR